MKPGDKSIVTKNINSHGFKIGEEIELVYLHADGDWSCHNENGDWYFLTEEEFELCEE